MYFLVFSWKQNIDWLFWLFQKIKSRNFETLHLKILIYNLQHWLVEYIHFNMYVSVPSRRGKIIYRTVPSRPVLKNSIYTVPSRREKQHFIYRSERP